MDKFNTTREKVRKNYENARSNEVEILSQQNINSVIENDVSLIPATQSRLTKDRSFSTDWEVFTTVLDAEGKAVIAYKNWEVVWDQLDEALIPSIRYDIFHRLTGTDNWQIPPSTFWISRQRASTRFICDISWELGSPSRKEATNSLVFSIRSIFSIPILQQWL